MEMCENKYFLRKNIEEKKHKTENTKKRGNCEKVHGGWLWNGFV